MLTWVDQTLQRGRARAGAEIPPDCLSVARLILAASTGPRPRGRGNCGFNPALEQLIFASTGPRPRGRGNETPTSKKYDQFQLQRGRARAGAEIPHPQTGLRWDKRLQRGRARAGAEIKSLMPMCLTCWRLQRGRARAGAEIGIVTVIQFAGDVSLQRGRARAGAEIRRTYPHSTRRGSCFNGAAPARARK